jgi:anaerobic ribonucleoside-triphosphate reductase activating protein
MKIDRLLFPIETLGPGNRLVIWTKGCHKHCYKCANPELWDAECAREISVKELAGIVRNIHLQTPIEGLTFTGGDPLEQAEELLDLLAELKEIIPDILVYTGYVYEELKADWSSEMLKRLEQYVSVLIDGPYIDEKNNSCPLRGSDNQNIYIWDERYEARYREYLTGDRKIQNVYMGNRLISVGMHSRNEDREDEKA